MYFIAERTDFAQQTDSVNVIDDTLIHELNRVICYLQPIYEDIRLERDEYAGLTLGVRNNSDTTIITTVMSMFDQASILILDNDSE